MKKILPALLFLTFIKITHAQTIDAGDTIIFDLSSASCISNYFLVPVSFNSDDEIYAVDFSMKYDESKITYHSIVEYQPAVSSSAYYNFTDSTLRFTSFSMSVIPDDTPVVAIRFNLLNNPVTEADFNSVIVYLNGDVCSYKMIPPSPPVVITAGGPLTINLGDSVALTASPGNGFSYLWSTNDTSQTIYVSAQGTYFVTVTNAGGCTSTDSVTVILNAPLPVVLTVFSAKEESGKVVVEWTTASEINNDYFKVERSTDGITWLTLVKIEGAGNTSEEHHYSALDEMPEQGINYYRLGQADYDGTCWYSEVNVVRITRQSLARLSISVFPNPATDHLNLLSSETVFIHIVDAFGNEVRLAGSIPENQELKIDTQQLAPGNYTVKVYRRYAEAAERSISVIVMH